jgi:hypothetical protein
MANKNIIVIGASMAGIDVMKAAALLQEGEKEERKAYLVRQALRSE